MHSRQSYSTNPASMLRFMMAGLFLACAMSPIADAVPIPTRKKMHDAIPEVSLDTNAEPSTIVVLAPWTPDREDLIHHALALLTEFEKKTGTLVIKVIDNPDDWIAFDDLESVDAFVLLNGEGYSNPLETKAARTRLIKAVRAGSGLVLLHSAINLTTDWPELADLANATYSRILPPAEVLLMVDGWDHQFNQGFAEPSRQMKLPVLVPGDSLTRDHARMLLTAVVTSEDGTQSRVPLSWIPLHDTTRVFCSTLGDNPDQYSDPGIVAHWLAGLRYAAGAIEVDDRPSAAIRGFLSKYEALDAVRSEESATERDATSAVAEIMYHDAMQGDTEADEVETELLDLLRNESASAAAREFACRQLARFGGARSAPTLMKLLDDPVLSDFAFRALEQLGRVSTSNKTTADDSQTPDASSVDQQLFDLAMNQDAADSTRASALLLLGRRDAESLTQQVHDAFFEDEDAALRHAAYMMVAGAQATIYNYANDMIADYLHTENDTERQALLDALCAMYIPGAGQTAYGPMFNAVAFADGTVDKQEIQRICDAAERIGGYRASQTVIMFGRENDPEVWKAMERSLMNWPDGLAHKALMIMAETEKEMGQDRQALLERFVEMIDEMEGFPAHYRATALVRAFGLSNSRDTDLKIARAAAFLHDGEAITVADDVLRKYPNDPEIVRAACRAIIAVSGAVGWSNRDTAIPALDHVIEQLEESQLFPALRERAQQTKKSIDDQ